MPKSWVMVFTAAVMDSSEDRSSWTAEAEKPSALMASAAFCPADRLREPMMTWYLCGIWNLEMVD